MIVRTSLMVACMIVVPGLALCSHHLPAELRAAARCEIWQPVASRVQSWFTSSDHQKKVEPFEALPAWDGMAVEPPSAPVADDADATDAQRLAALGAVAVDCRPLEAGSGMHVASCRIAMDAAGQLHRVFQAAGPTPDAATAALVAQVDAWRQRLAMRATSPVSSWAPDGP